MFTEGKGQRADRENVKITSKNIYSFHNFIPKEKKERQKMKEIRGEVALFTICYANVVRLKKKNGIKLSHPDKDSCGTLTSR